MTIQDCKMARGLHIILGLFFGFMALGLFLLGVSLLPVIGIIMAAMFLVISLLFLFAPRDPVCYLNR